MLLSLFRDIYKVYFGLRESLPFNAPLKHFLCEVLVYTFVLSEIIRFLTRVTLPRPFSIFVETPQIQSDESPVSSLDSGTRDVVTANRNYSGLSYDVAGAASVAADGGQSGVRGRGGKGSGIADNESSRV